MKLTQALFMVFIIASGSMSLAKMPGPLTSEQMTVIGNIMGKLHDIIQVAEAKAKSPDTEDRDIYEVMGLTFSADLGGLSRAMEIYNSGKAKENYGIDCATCLVLAELKNIYQIYPACATPDDWKLLGLVPKVPALPAPPPAPAPPTP